MMKRVVIAGLIAGLAMFVWESFTHMAMPLGKVGMSPLPDEMAVREALAAYIGTADGLYFFPWMEEMGTPPPGPWGLLVFHPEWNFSWSTLGWEALTHLIQGLTLAFIVSLAAAASFARRFALALLVGVIAAIAVPRPPSPSGTASRPPTPPCRCSSRSATMSSPAWWWRGWSGRRRFHRRAKGGRPERNSVTFLAAQTRRQLRLCFAWTAAFRCNRA
ncbi:MAG: hypothetical protein ACT4OE_08670 [Sphingosinicella sp.]